MLRGDMGENTALAVRGDSLESGMAEAYALLHDGADQVLLVLADEPLSAAYDVAAYRAPWPYALAMVLTRGANYRLSLMPYESAVDNQGAYWGALAWIRFMLSDGLEHMQHDGTRRWLWQKSA